MNDDFGFELESDLFPDDETECKSGYCHLEHTQQPTKNDTTQCDNCGTFTDHIVARYDDETYCPTCYKTWFKPFPCQMCGEVARFHKRLAISEQICLKCKADLPCRMCGGNKQYCFNSKKHGRICSICFHKHYAATKKCEACGKSSSNVWKRKHSGARLCAKCHSKANNEKVCPKCRHQRILQDTPHGEMCQKCFEMPQRLCPECNETKIHGGQSRCDACYWTERLRKITEEQLPKLQNESTKSDFQAFTMWLVERKQSKAGVLKVDLFMAFFLHCERIFACVPKDYAALVNEFKPNGLRAYLTVLRWLVETGLVVIDANLKQELSEQECIQKMLGRFNGNVPPVIQAFHDFLLEKMERQETTLKSFRLAFNAAARVYLSQDLETHSTPNQAQIDEFIRKHKGQFAALSAFIGFLRTRYGCELEYTRKRYQTEPTALDKRRQHQSLQREIVALALVIRERQPKKPSWKDKLRWITLNMAFHHGIKVSLNAAKTIQILPSQDDEVAFVVWKSQQYAIPILIGTNFRLPEIGIM